MPGLIIRIDQSVGGVDLAALAAGASDQYAGLAALIAQWQTAPPGDFGAALGGLASLRTPDLSIPGNLNGIFSGLLPSLQGDLGGIVATLEADIAALPEQVRGELTAAIEPLLARIAALQGLLENDWSCGLVAAFSPPPSGGAGASAGAGGGGGGGTDEADESGDTAAGALSPTQVTEAKARIDSLPADLSVPTLLHWVHERVGTFRPGYFTLRSLPVLDDLRDPLDTLIRWDGATATAVRNELQATIGTLAALVRTATSAQFAAALPPAAVAVIPAAALGAAAEAHVVAVEALAAAVQAGDISSVAARLTTAQATRAALLAQNTALAATPVASARTALLNGLAGLPGALDAGLCRTLVLLQPRASFADLTEGIGPLQIPPLPDHAFAALTAQLDALRELLTELLDALDIGAVTAPVTEAIGHANDAVAAVEAGLAQLTGEAVRALSEVQDGIAAIDLDSVRAELEDALEGVTHQLATTVSNALATASGALADALSAAGTAMDAIDPETLTEPIHGALDALGDLANEAPVQQLRAIVEQLEALAQTVARLSFEPVADEVIKAIGELDALIRSIDPAKLPAPGPSLIREAMGVLPKSLTPLTDPLIVDLDVQIEASPIALLEQVKALPDQARTRLLAFSPRAALEPLLGEPYRRATDELRNFSPAQWLNGADSALAELRARLRRELDVAALLAEAARAHAAVLAELDRLRPSALLAPLSSALQAAVQALADAVPAGDLAGGLTAVLDRVRGLTRTLDAAIDVAEHLVTRLDTIGDPGAQFDDWITAILAKVPETATGGLADALTDLRAATRDVRPEQLAAEWAASRQGLADALAASNPTSRLTRLATARSRVQGALSALPPAAAPERSAIAAWLAEAQTAAAGDGLAALAALERTLAQTDATLRARLEQLGARFPHQDGPLAPLVPGDPAALRAWVREALVRQFGLPVVSFLDGLKFVASLLAAAVEALRALVDAVNAKLDDVLAAPQALADLLGSVASVQQRLGTLDPDFYAREIDTLHGALLDEFRALDPRRLATPLEAARDQLLQQISLDAALPAALRGQLDALHRDLLMKIGALDPDALLLAPLDEAWRASVEPLVAALDVGVPVQIIIDWLRGLPPDLRAQIGRVDVAYGRLLQGAPGGGGSAGASVSISVGA